MGLQCRDCGAKYADFGDSCDKRFDQLLALDHSHREPWGSRHGLAFAAYALQHPSAFPAATLDQSWKILYRVYLAGDDPGRVLKALAGKPPAITAKWDVPPRPPTPPRYPQVTIADLADFAAEKYAAMLDSWCRATVEWISGRK